jgi:hypothetical protein
VTDVRGCRAARLAAVIVAVALSVSAGAVATPVMQPPQLIDYELEDQFEVVHANAEVRERVVVVIAAGRKGREHTAAWGDVVRARLSDWLRADEVAVVPVADLRGVPGFLKGRIRGRFPEEPQRWVLMDWGGRFAEAYELDEESVSLLLFASDGALVTRMSAREVNDALVAHLSGVVEETVATAPERR